MSGLPGDDVNWSFLQLTLDGSEQNKQWLSCVLLGEERREGEGGGGGGGTLDLSFYRHFYTNCLVTNKLFAKEKITLNPRFFSQFFSL